jgi:ubiquitin-like protein Pup
VSPGQQRETKPKPRTHEHVSSPENSKQLNEQKKKAKKLAKEMDELLTEVDQVLDENEDFKNAQTFIEGWVQKGGE